MPETSTSEKRMLLLFKSLVPVVLLMFFRLVRVFCVSESDRSIGFNFLWLYRDHHA